MKVSAAYTSLTAESLAAVLTVTAKLALPFDLLTMLKEVVDAAKSVLDAEGGSVWLYDATTNELVLEVAEGIPPVRVPMGVGIVGASAEAREIINVPDCYADPRFNPELDRQTHVRTRCLLTLPLVDHHAQTLVGVMQVLNKRGGVFNEDDVALATALAAQCVVALQRVRMTEALLEGQRMKQALEVAREVQLSTLPGTMPEVPGYDLFGTFRPAELTGGDTFDLIVLDQGLFMLLGDATGHGIAPALSATQMQAMLRVAFRLGADLDSAFIHVNNQLLEDLADDRFVTAFVGFLDAAAHEVRFQSGGQGPLLHYQAATGACLRYRPTTFPLAAMPMDAVQPARVVAMAPGDVLVLVTDGIYEYTNSEREEFGDDRVEAVLRAHHQRSTAELAEALVEAVLEFAGGAPQEDDITIVLVKRLPELAEKVDFPRDFGALEDIFAFTARFFSQAGLDKDMLRTVDFVIEELFTNMVKYSRESEAAIRLELQHLERGVEVTLTDRGVDAFDVTQGPEVDIGLPAEARTPGGLGLHLTKKLVDWIEYQYAARRSTITFRVTDGKHALGEDDVQH